MFIRLSDILWLHAVGNGHLKLCSNRKRINSAMRAAADDELIFTRWKSIKRKFDDWPISQKLTVHALEEHRFIHSLLHSSIEAISIAPLQVHYYPEALPTQQGYCVGVSRRSVTGNCE